MLAASLGYLIAVPSIGGVTCGLGLLTYIGFNEFGHFYARKALKVQSTQVKWLGEYSHVVPFLKVEAPRTYYEELMVTCGGAAGGIIGAYGVGLTGMFLESHLLMDVGFFVATCAAFNISFPISALDGGRFFSHFWREYTMPYWFLQGTASFMAAMVPPVQPSLFVASAVIVGANAKEYWNRDRQEGYYDVSDGDRLRLSCAVIFVFYCSTLHWEESDWIWARVDAKGAQIKELV